MKITLVISFLFLSLSLPAFAVTDCAEAQITGVQVTDTNVVVKRNNIWHLVGVYTDPGMKEKLSALLAAQASGKGVVLKFQNDGYDCDLQTYSSRVYAVRIVN